MKSAGDSGVSEMVHVWKMCHSCGMRPIVGERFECRTCSSGPDNDLCRICFERYKRGEIDHPRLDSTSWSSQLAAHIFESSVGRARTEFMHWLTVPFPSCAWPNIQKHFVVRPEFICDQESFFGSYAFAVRSIKPEDLLLMTGLHVMDEIIRFNGIDCSPENGLYSGRRLSDIVKSVAVYDVFSPKWMLSRLGAIGPMLVMDSARVGDEEPFSNRDIAAFRIPLPSILNAATLATKNPAVGDPIWLAVNSGVISNKRCMMAVVVESTEATLVYRFALGTESPRNSSGAPMVNSSGEVVGINLGKGALNGKFFGHAHTVLSIRRHLELAYLGEGV
jgi:hypothetical protein